MCVQKVNKGLTLSTSGSGKRQLFLNKLKNGMSKLHVGKKGFPINTENANK